MKIRDNKTELSENHKNKHIRLNNNAYFLLGTILFIFALSQSLSLLMLSMNIKQEVINYKEKGNIDYKVYLKQNDFYENDYLNNNMVYVSSLINKINTTYNYKVEIDKETNMTYDYEIIGQIIIYNSTKENVFFKKDYILSNKKQETLQNTKEINIEKNIDIDYEYYNNLASKFRRNYGVNSKSDFIVKLKVNYNNDDKSLNIANNKELSITIPLTENEVTINSQSAKVETNKQVLGKKHLTIESSRKLASSIALALISLVIFIYIIVNLFNEKKPTSKYDKLIKKILKEYDRLIVNTSSPPVLNKDKVLIVDNFQELLDVHDNLGIPIMYYIIEEHKKCTFYINHDDEIFIYKVKETEL